jgi:plasmid stability protein
MPDVLVRDVDEAALARLKERARGNGRSLGSELRMILERVAAERVVDIAEARARAERISRSLEGRPHSDSAALIREDRDR